jgi:hypothetical protein
MNTESSQNATAISERHKETIIAMLRSEGLFFPMIRIEWRKRLGPVAYAAVEEGLKEEPGCCPISDLTDEDGVYYETVKLRGVWTGWNEFVETDADRKVFELRDIIPCYLNPAWHSKLAELVGYNIPGKPAPMIPPEANVSKCPPRPVRKARHVISVKQAMQDFGVSKTAIEAWLRGERNPPRLFNLDDAIQYGICLAEYSENKKFRKVITRNLTTGTGRHKGRQTRLSDRIETADPGTIHHRPGDDED